MIVEVVRHAHAGKRGAWTGGPDRERPLSDKGKRQAEWLVRDLTDNDDAGGTTVIVSSSFTRCVMTVEPLAQELGVKIATDEALEELNTVPISEGGDAWVNAAWIGGRALDLVMRCIAEGKSDRLVLCSHGDVVPAVMALLAGRDSLPITDVACRKGGRFRLTFEQQRCIEAVGVPPPTEDGPQGI